MGISKTSDHIQIKIKMPNPSQKPPASSKPPNEDLKDGCSLHLQNQGREQNLDQCTFNFKIVKIWIMAKSKTSDHIQIKIKMPNPSREPPASSKVMIMAQLKANEDEDED